ncbi:MAG: catechol 2,3-dioxygenase [Telmatospirillum sp.]|nr:catechol 2,3-dioxygenase [Telmatospirillum sp.]
MAMTGVLRPGFAQLRVLDMDAAVRHYVDYIGLSLVSREADGRVYLKAWDEFDRHSVVLREADHAGIDVMAFKVDSDASLADFARRSEAFGLTVDHVGEGEQPGLGRRVGVTIPSGHRIELYADIAAAETAPGTHNPYLWHEAPHGMGAIRMDHGLLYGPNIEQVLAYFTEVLDFRLTEKVDLPDGLLGIWMSCSNKAHDIAFVKHPEPGKLHHLAFFLEDWNAVGHAADLMIRHDVAIDIGPTRHGITRGQTIYFFDPSGNRNEVFAGGYQFYPDQPVRTWDHTEIGRGIFYYERALNDRFLSVVT